MVSYNALNTWGDNCSFVLKASSGISVSWHPFSKIISLSFWQHAKAALPSFFRLAGIIICFIEVKVKA